ncbi:MAG: glycosyl hydrolase family 57, partial [Candidatus Omnitrophica bacterium]|nr:glycosyl hydrolase family 57 [Candidatus Omnitrophota bacterium]
MTTQTQEIIDGLPNICGDEDNLTVPPDLSKPCMASVSGLDISKVRSAFGIALHMHQPTIPASSDDVRSAGLIGNLQHMWEHQGMGDNHNAPVFLNCYERMADIIPDLVNRGKS